MPKLSKNSRVFSKVRGHIRLFSFVKRTQNSYLIFWEEIVSRYRSFGRMHGQQSLAPNMTYTPQHIANYFLERAELEGVRLSPLKLIKLVYIAYGWGLALLGKRLYNEDIEAWKHGPVIPSIYHEFKEFGSGVIDRRAYDLDLDTLDFYAPQVEEDDDQTRLVLDRVWASYRRFTGWQLREKTHEPDSPWSKVFKDNVRGITLNDDDIKQHFAEKIGGYLEAANAIHVERPSNQT